MLAVLLPNYSLLTESYSFTAMAVEASINSKKATPLYKQNIIGKGITTLDDFNDYSSVRHFFSFVFCFIKYCDEF